MTTITKQRHRRQNSSSTSATIPPQPHDHDHRQQQQIVLYTTKIKVLLKLKVVKTNTQKQRNVTKQTHAKQSWLSFDKPMRRRKISSCYYMYIYINLLHSNSKASLFRGIVHSKNALVSTTFCSLRLSSMQKSLRTSDCLNSAAFRCTLFEPVTYLWSHLFGTNHPVIWLVNFKPILNRQIQL